METCWYMQPQLQNSYLWGEFVDVWEETLVPEATSAARVSQDCGVSGQTWKTVCQGSKMFRTKSCQKCFKRVQRELRRSNGSNERLWSPPWKADLPPIATSPFLFHITLIAITFWIAIGQKGNGRSETRLTLQNVCLAARQRPRDEIQFSFPAWITLSVELWFYQLLWLKCLAGRLA